MTIKPRIHTVVGLLLAAASVGANGQTTWSEPPTAGEDSFFYEAGRCVALYESVGLAQEAAAVFDAARYQSANIPRDSAFQFSTRFGQGYESQRGAISGQSDMAVDTRLELTDCEDKTQREAWN